MTKLLVWIKIHNKQYFILKKQEEEQKNKTTIYWHLLCQFQLLVFYLQNVIKLYNTNITTSNLSKVESMHKYLTISIKRYISTGKKHCITINSQNMSVS